jgi:hypothetical protein
MHLYETCLNILDRLNEFACREINRTAEVLSVPWGSWGQNLGFSSFPRPPPFTYSLSPITWLNIMVCTGQYFIHLDHNYSHPVRVRLNLHNTALLPTHYPSFYTEWTQNQSNQNYFWPYNCPLKQTYYKRTHSYENFMKIHKNHQHVASSQNKWVFLKNESTSNFISYHLGQWNGCYAIWHLKRKKNSWKKHNILQATLTTVTSTKTETIPSLTSSIN